jgi:GT2 family glycosyltransferase
MSVILDEDSIDDILYLARTNEAQELDEFLSTLSAQTKQSKAELIAAAVDPHSKNGPIHYAAANGHIGTALRDYGFGRMAS